MMSSLIKFVRQFETEIMSRASKYSCDEDLHSKAVAACLIEIAEAIASAAKATLLA